MRAVPIAAVRKKVQVPGQSQILVQKTAAIATAAARKKVLNRTAVTAIATDKHHNMKWFN
jgi:hypothetical protein